MTWEEFNKPLPMEDNPRYQKTDIECPECKKFIYKDIGVMLMTDPPQYRYVCECGWSGYSYY